MAAQSLGFDGRGAGRAAGSKASLALLACALAATSGLAPTVQAEDMFTKENVGKAVGAVTGALIGSQIGGGTGKVAAVAVGTLAGYWVGGKIGRSLSERDRAGIASTTEQALETGESQSWRNPETGVYTEVSVADDTNSSRLPEAPPMEYVNAWYTATSNVNVRGGPGTGYAIVDRLSRGERVPVVGQVMGQEWYMIAEGGQGSGFVYAPLLARSDVQAVAGNAIREATRSGEPPRTYAVAESQCRMITQEVVLPGGERQKHNFRACRKADGSWVRT